MTTDPDQIRSEIDQTQRELSADVNTLTDKLSPPRMVERRVRRTRMAMTNMKGKIMGSTSDAYQTAGTASSSAPDMVRRRTEGNPLAAGLIAFGAGWLLSSLLPASTPEQQVATQVKDFATEQGRPAARQLGEAGQQAAQQLRESAQQRAESVKDTAADAASTVAGEAKSAASDVTGQAQQSAGQVKDHASP